MTIPDPRTFPPAADPPPHAAQLHALAAASLAARDGLVASAQDRGIDAELARLLADRDGAKLAAVFATAPDVSTYRHLWRALAQRTQSGAATGQGIAAVAFALPVVLVAALSVPDAAPARLPAVLADAGEFEALLREHRALGGSQTFALANALVASDALDIARVPAWLAAAEARVDGGAAPLAPEPAPIAVVAMQESVHLRYLLGTALAAPGVDLLRETGVGPWAMPFAQALSRQLAWPGVTVLALPRAPQSLVSALAQGRAAQREVSAQIFASNAIRKLRGAVGEPIAVISAHRAPDAPGGGELRLSLSSVFDPREAEGFRCPLYPQERAADVAAMLVDLMRDCRIADVRVLAGVHPDRDAATGLPLLFKPETSPAALH